MGVQGRLRRHRERRSAPAAPSPVIGNGTHRLTHRAHDGVTTPGPTWVDHFVRIDADGPRRTRPPRPRPPGSKGPVNVPLTAHATPPRPCTCEWRVGGGSWTTGNSRPSPAPARTSSTTAAVDAAGNRTERNDTVQDRRHASRSTPTVTPVGWQNGPVDVTVTGTDAHSGVDRVEWQLDAQPLGSGPAGTVVHDRHARPAQLPHARRRRGRQRERVDRPHRAGRHRRARPTRPSSRPAGSPTPSVDDQHHRRPTTAPRGITAHRVASSTAPRPATSSAPDTTPVTVTGDGVHKLEVRITDDRRPRLDWHTHQVKIDTVNPVDNTTVAAGWLPLDLPRRASSRGTDAHSRVQGVEWRLDGGDVRPPPRTTTRSASSGNGVHTLETRIVDNAGRAQRLDGAHDQARRDGCPTNTTPTVPDGLAQHALLGRAQRHGRRLRRRLRQLADRARGPAGGRRASRARATSTQRQHQPGRHAHARAPASATTPATTPRGAPRRSASTASLPTDDTAYPAAPVGNRHVVTFNPQDDRSGVAGVEWKLDGGAVQTDADGHDHRRGRAHADRARAGQRRQLERLGRPHDHGRQLGLDTTAADRHHRRSRRRGSSARTRSPSPPRTTSTAPASTTSSGATATSQTGQGPSGSDVHDHRPTASTRSRRARSTGRQRLRRGSRQTLRIDTTQPTDTSTRRRRGWTNSRTFTLRATDATSGVASIEYKIDNGAPDHRSPAAPPSRSRPTALPRSATARSTTPASATGWKDDDVQASTRSCPANTSAAAPTDVADERAVARADRHRRRVGRRPRRVARGRRRRPDRLARRWSTTEGTQTLETRIVDKAGNASAWRSETIRIDTTKPVNTTAAP